MARSGRDAASPLAMHPACAPFSRRILRQLAGVDLGDGDHVAAVEELRQRLGGAPVRVQQRQVADHEPGGMDRVRLEVVRVGPGIADVGIGERDDLAGIGRVGQDFLVARHGGVEHHLARRGPGGADGNAAEHGAVLESQNSGCRHDCASVAGLHTTCGPVSRVRQPSEMSSAHPRSCLAPRAKYGSLRERVGSCHASFVARSPAAFGRRRQVVRVAAPGPGIGSRGRRKPFPGGSVARRPCRARPRVTDPRSGPARGRFAAAARRRAGAKRSASGRESRTR